MEPRRDQLRAGEARRFGLTVGTASLVLAALFRWRGRPAAAAGLSLVGILLCAGGLVLPERLGPAYRAWMTLAALLNRLTTPLLLAVVYFVVITPVALLTRLFGRDSLARPNRALSYWVPRRGGAQGRSSMDHQF